MLGGVVQSKRHFNSYFKRAQLGVDFQKVRYVSLEFYRILRNFYLIPVIRQLHSINTSRHANSSSNVVIL